ncbi:unnamed protein product [Clonostachys rosea]|uniref:BZIP domain-containing protein n=1 Tax=Bionectria ochroleuca TaxID=29856 RepID=A0ABY6UNH2_BIOOC|nr:unnamed protein product [Clonostachys rosea]
MVTVEVVIPVALSSSFDEVAKPDTLTKTAETEQWNAQDRQKENRRNRQAQDKKMKAPPVRAVRKRGRESHRVKIHRSATEP